MKPLKRALIALVLFLLIIGGLQFLKHDEKAYEASVNTIARIHERMEKAKEKQETILQWMRARYMLNSQEEEAMAESTEGAIHYSTDNGTTEPYTYDTGNAFAYKYDTGYIFMGDSRIYLMNIDCNIEAVGNFFVVCCPGIGYDWMISNGLPEVNKIKYNHPEIKNWVLISAFGINDMNRVNDYVSTYTDLAKSMDLRILSVNPTLGRAEAQYSNNNIETFNQRLQEIAGVQYIDCYSYLVNKGYWMTDGLHYNEESNWDIYAFVLDHLYYNSGMVTGANSKERAQQLQQRMSSLS